MKIVKQNVELVDHMGSDLSVVNAARVSFAKVHGEFMDKDVKLLNYLAAHGHWSPFAHTSITLRLKTPIFIARQLVKHQVGLSWNEVSRRYVDDEPEFFFPEQWRGRPVNAKQGSSDEVIDVSDFHVEESIEYQLLYQYNNLLAKGVAPEQARMVLPQNTMTEWVWTGSVMAFARVYKQRSDPHAQLEAQEVAKMINDVVEPLFPHSWKALTR